jgi:hypothetical protein
MHPPSNLRPVGLLLGLLVLAAPAPGLVHRPISLTFIPPLSTNGFEAGDVVSEVSIGIIGDYIGAVRGCQAASVFGILSAPSSGVQAAGAIAVAAARFRGVQASGAVNISAGPFELAQLAGAVNIAAGEFGGAQLAGGVNVSGNLLQGAQVAGGANVSGGLVQGAQVAGGANVAERFDGVQLAPVNVAGSGSGLQLGVVNVCGELDGEAIGVVNIIGNGIFDIELAAGDAPLFGVMAKTGGRTIYGVVGFGLHPLDPTRTGWAWGIGGRKRSGRFEFDLDAVGWAMGRPGEPFSSSSGNVLAKLRGTAGWRLVPGFAVFAGPTVNVWISDDGQRFEGLHDFAFYDNESAGTRVIVWPGFTAGLRLL